MRQIAAITTGAILLFTFTIGGFAFNQANTEEAELSSEMQSRTQVIAGNLAESINPVYFANATTTLNRFVSDTHVAGLAVFSNASVTVARSENLPSETVPSADIRRAMDGNEPVGSYVQSGNKYLYIHTIPLHNNERVVGALAVVQDAALIKEGIQQVWLNNALRLLLHILLFAGAIFLFLRFVVFRPLSHMTEALKSLRTGSEPRPNPHRGWLWAPLTSEIAKVTASLRQARATASEEARMRLEKLDSPWTAQRLKEFIKAYLKDRPIYVVSHIEPFIHKHEGREIRAVVPAGGVATALSAVMEACGGTWVAYAGGDADKETADEYGRLEVPPDEPKYTLKRVWLTEKDFQGYYLGFSNEALWPLSHIAHVRPSFRKEDWEAYRRVNTTFAEELLAEIEGVENPLILIQDYHFALLSAMIKKARPDAQVAFFWHIPWPSPEVFSINPWRKEILQGILGADVVGFHTQQYCNNFVETVGKELEALIDLERFSVTHGEHTSFVKPFPISIAFTDNKEEVDGEPDQTVLERLGIEAPHLILGVDRMDYTKGILERLRGIEFLLDEHPEHRGQIAFLQIGSPTRERIQKYQDYGQQVEAEVERINRKFKVNGWQPIVLERRQYSHRELHPLYKRADVCVVTSLHDGMNLVSKEFVAARSDEAGALVLSSFTGAARDLRKGALIVNPYSAEETGEAIHEGLMMSPAEQRRRMKAMRAAVKDYNIYRWSAELIKTVANLG